MELKSFDEWMNEKTGDKVIFVKDELWVTYSQSSGQTIQFPDIKKFVTNNPKDNHYDSSVDKIVKWAKVNKPLKSNKSKTNLLFEIPVYPTTQAGTDENSRYDIWGGTIKPLKKYYMIINLEGIVVVNLFDNKNEALAWINSIS